MYMCISVNRASEATSSVHVETNSHLSALTKTPRWKERICKLTAMHSVWFIKNTMDILTSSHLEDKLAHYYIQHCISSLSHSLKNHTECTWASLELMEWQVAFPPNRYSIFFACRRALSILNRKCEAAEWVCENALGDADVGRRGRAWRAQRGQEWCQEGLRASAQRGCLRRRSERVAVPERLGQEDSAPGI